MKIVKALSLLLFCGVTSAQASVITVDALANSTSGGVGASTGIVLNAGDFFSATAALDDLWSAGALPRWSNGDGLTAATFATGTDESGQPAGTQIGADFGLWGQHGLNLPYGTLVGSIAGTFFEIGTSFAGNAIASGELLLWYWDSNSGDNVGSIDLTVTTSSSPVPEPLSLLLLGAGLVGLGLRNKQRSMR